MPVAPIAKAHLSQYTVKSSDVLTELRVNVLEEGTENVVWYKERVMTEDEIVERVVDSASNTVRWTVHRPKRGWYLRLRCPSFPPGAFIALLPPNVPFAAPAASSQTLPPPATAPAIPRPKSDGSLTFSVRTALSIPKKPSQDEIKIDVSVHSYPPTPPAAPSPSPSHTLTVSSAGELNAKLHALGPRPNVMRFLLSPSLPESVPTFTASAPRAIFARALTYFTPTLPIRASASFTLARLASPGEVCIPLLTFTDRTSTFSVLTTGRLEVNKGIEHQVGVDPAFWIAVALGYLEFLTDRDASVDISTSGTHG